MLHYNKEIEPGAVIDYLEFEIRNTGDGLVLSKKDYDCSTELWKCHLGNYSTIMDAKHAAILYWMISRPEDFQVAIFYRIMKRGGCSHDYYGFKKSIEKAGYTMPKEITPGDGLNALIYFNGKPLSDHWDQYKTV